MKGCLKIIGVVVIIYLLGCLINWCGCNCSVSTTNTSSDTITFMVEGEVYKTVVISKSMTFPEDPQVDGKIFNMWSIKASSLKSISEFENCVEDIEVFTNSGELCFLREEYPGTVLSMSIDTFVDSYKSAGITSLTIYANFYTF